MPTVAVPSTSATSSAGETPPTTANAHTNGTCSIPRQSGLDVSGRSSQRASLLAIDALRGRGIGTLGRAPGTAAYRALSSSVTSETDFFASPNSMEVVSAKNSGLSMPANPEFIDRLSTITDFD